MAHDDDEIVIDAEAISFIEEKEREEGLSLAKFEIIEYFFEWLKEQPPSYKVWFLKKVLHE